MTINFYLKNKSEATTSIILHLWAKKRVRFAIGETIDPKLWDDLKQYPVRRHESYSFLSRYIDKCRFEAKSYYESRRLDGLGVTQPSFREYMNSKLTQVEANPVSKTINLLEYMDLFINNRKRTSTYSVNTIKTYNKLKGRLEEYQKHSGAPLSFKSIDLDFFYDFSDWMFNIQKYALSTGNRYITYIKVVMRDAVENGYTDNLSFESKRFHIKYQPGDNIFLTEDELLHAYKHKFKPENEHLTKYRDLYLVASFTGLRFSDFSLLTPDHIVSIKNEDYVRKLNQKTRRTTYIPLHSVVKKIIPTIDIHNPPLIQVFNRQIKKAFKLMKFNQPIFIRSSKAGKIIEVKKEKWELITAHTARSNFITNCLISGIPEKPIMDMVGISKADTLKKYQRMTPKESAIIAMNNKFFSAKSKWLLNSI